jgi:RNA-directed DNA polymerase
MQPVYRNLFEDIVSIESLFSAWEEFARGKRKRPDVQLFADHLEQHLFVLHHELVSGGYRHGSYTPFTICDPKQRLIHKAAVRDRIVHHAMFAALNPLFERTFIAHSFSCRKGKGTHKGVDALETMLRKTSKNFREPCFALKCDIHRFFASVDHTILLRMLGARIKDEKVMTLLREIIESFQNSQGKGIPIGNLTSQLFANVYMNEFDHFMKHSLRLKHYVRYTDDFLIVAPGKEELQKLIPVIEDFLNGRLCLALHPHKVSIRKYRQGIDFLGYVLLPHHRVLRTTTKRRMLRKLHEASVQKSSEHVEQSLQSYLGVLSHADAFGFSQNLRNAYSMPLS